MIAIFFLLSNETALLYMLVDLGLYLFYKIIRADFYYWMPIEGCLEICGSLLARIMVKVVADFTSLGELRLIFDKFVCVCPSSSHNKRNFDDCYSII